MVVIRRFLRSDNTRVRIPPSPARFIYPGDELESTDGAREITLPIVSEAIQKSAKTPNWKQYGKLRQGYAQG